MKNDLIIEKYINETSNVQRVMQYFKRIGKLLFNMKMEPEEVASIVPGSFGGSFLSDLVVKFSKKIRNAKSLKEIDKIIDEINNKYIDDLTDGEFNHLERLLKSISKELENEN